MDNKKPSRHLWLLAALVFFVAGVFGIWSISRKEHKQFPTPEQPVAVVATPELKPTPTPRPEPTPQSSMKRVGQLDWEIFLVRGDWFDTKLPIIAGSGFEAERIDNSGTRWLAKVNGTVVYDNDFDRKVRIRAEEGEHNIGFVSAGFRDTIKLKIQDDNSSVHLKMKLIDCMQSLVENVGFKPCCGEAGHVALHERSYAWWKSMLQKLPQE